MNEVNIDLYKNVHELWMDFGELKAIEILKEKLGIEAKPVFADASTEIPYFYMLNYDQIESPKTHPIVMQCRSLIVTANFGYTVSAKYTRFFNVGEAPEIVGQIDIYNSTIFDKDDGSLIGIWYNDVDCKWEISSRSMAKCDGMFTLPDGKEVLWSDMILSTLFAWSPAGVLPKHRERFQTYMNSIAEKIASGYDNTYIFEWVHPLNRIVTPYAEPAMVMTGVTTTKEGDKVIDRKTYFVESCAQTFAMFFDNVKMCEYFNSAGRSLQEIEDIVAGLKDLKEGFVIRCNVTGIRAKIKSKTYVTAHRLRGEFSVPRDKDLLELIRTNEHEEFLAYFPEWADRCWTIQQRWVQYLAFIERQYNMIKDIESQKEFAMLVQEGCKVGRYGTMAQSLFFGMRQGKGAVYQTAFFSKNKAYDFYEEIVKISN